jgi:hypothetical protein
MNRAARDERTQRIRIGLTGLAFVFLLVVLGTAISRSGDNAAPPRTTDNLAEESMPNEPLAEIGAAPGTAAANETVAESGNTSQ